MSTQRLLLDSYLKTLKLPTMRAEYEAIARKCSEADAAYEDFLQQLANWRSSAGQRWPSNAGSNRPSSRWSRR